MSFPARYKTPWCHWGMGWHRVCQRYKHANTPCACDCHEEHDE